MSLDIAILGFLAEHPRTGYDLKRRCFAGPVSSFWTADQAQIYRTLERLKTAKLVRSTRRKRAGRPDRVTYELTSAGSAVLAEDLATPAPPVPTRDPFLVRLFFGASLTDEQLRVVLEREREAHIQRLERLEHHSHELAEQSELSPRAAVLKQTAIDGAVVRERALVEWLDVCIHAIDEGAVPPPDEVSTEQGQTGS